MKKNSTRLKTLKKKALELQTLCAVDVAFVYVVPDGQLPVFPEDPLHLRRLLDRYVTHGGEAAAINNEGRRRRRKNISILADEGCSSSLLLGGPTASLLDAGSSSSSSTTRREEATSKVGEGHTWEQEVMVGEMSSSKSEQGQGEISGPKELVWDMEEEGLVWPDVDSTGGQPQSYQLPSAAMDDCPPQLFPSALNYAMDNQTQTLPSALDYAAMGDQTQPLPSALNYAMDVQTRSLLSAQNYAMDDWPQMLPSALNYTMDVSDPDSCDCFDLGWLWQLLSSILWNLPASGGVDSG